MRLVLATRNRHKVLELIRLLRVPGITWHSLAEFPSTPNLPERGRTFFANAASKARAASAATGLLALADDSGLEVDGLDGAPGVRSARFAGRQGDDAANNRKLLKLARKLSPCGRRARYRCVLVLADARRPLAVGEGAVEGEITLEPKGRMGFGYDPLFWLPKQGRTMAQIPLNDKNRISHRAQACRAMRLQLRRFVQQLNASTRAGGPRRRAGSGRRAAAR